MQSDTTNNPSYNFTLDVHIKDFVSQHVKEDHRETFEVNCDSIDTFKAALWNKYSIAMQCDVYHSTNLI